MRALAEAQQAELRALLPRADLPKADSSQPDTSAITDTSATAAVATSATAGPGAPIPSGQEESDPSPPVSADVRSRRGRSTKVGRVVVALVSTAALIATGIAWVSLHWFQGNTNTTDVIADLGDDPNAPADDGVTDILLIGNDTRTDAQGNPLPLDVLKKLRTEATTSLNTDTIMVLRIPHDGGQAEAVSIPRDTYTTIPGIPNNKINAAYGLAKKRVADRLRAEGDTSATQVERASDNAGRRALVSSVQDLTGLRVDHYAEISLYGFYLLTQAIGGVPVCLNNATTDKDSGADFKAGPQTVSGGDALAFVRQRRNLPHGDLDRIVRQQVFLAAAAKKVLSAGTLTKPDRLRALANTVRKSLTLDDGLDLLSLVQQAQSLLSGNVRFVTIPVTNRNGRSPDGQSIVTVDKQQVRRFARDVVTDSGGPPQQRHTPSGGPPGAGQPTATPTAAQNGAPRPAAPNSPTTSATARRHTPGTPSPPVTVDGTRCVD